MHTTEPWEIGNYDEIVADGDRLLVVGVQIPMTSGKRMEVGKANARRIVACVNACAGTPTEWLEKNAPVVLLGPPIADRFRRSCDIEQQRNSLLAAAKNLRDVKGRFHTEQAMKQLIEVVSQIEKMMK